MPLLLGAVADDYTGASDLANTLHRNGLSTVQTIGVPAAGFDAGDVEAIVVALKSARSRPRARSLRRPLLMTGSPPAARAMSSTKSARPSTRRDAGNIGPVGEAFRARAEAGCIVW